MNDEEKVPVLLPVYTQCRPLDRATLYREVVCEVRYDEHRVAQFKSAVVSGLNPMNGTLVALFANDEFFQFHSLDDLATLVFIHAKLRAEKLVMLGIVSIGENRL